VHTLPAFIGRVDRLPQGLDQVLITSDLQGRELMGPRLLGEALPEWLDQQGLISDPDRCLALLAGDLYASPDARDRGATGDVREVWAAFARHYRAVAAVLGNHDLVGSEGPANFAARIGLTLLDGQVTSLLDLRVGGVSGVVGKLGRPNRRSEPEFLRLVEDVLVEDPDILLLHMGPEGPEPDLRHRGSAALRQSLEQLDSRPLVAFGHCHWPDPLVESQAGQLLNVDGRAIILEALSAGDENRHAP
jgi:Icc-related predicted phosphoesterase